MKIMDRYYKLVFLLVLILFIIPFGWIAKYNFPQSDDWDLAARVLDFGYWGSLFNYYITLSGRYFTLFVLLFLNPTLSLNLTVFKILPIVYFIFTIGVYYVFLKSITKEQSKFELFLMSFSFSVFYVLIIPSVAEGFYWYTSTITYQTANLLLLIILSIFFNTSFNLNWKQVLILSILLFIIIGMNEMIIILTVITMCIYSYMYVRFLKGINLKIFSLWVVMGISLSLVVFCPGNHKRDKIYKNNHDINFTLEKASELFSEKVIDWIPNLLILTLMVVLLLNTKFKFKINLNVKMVILSVFVFFMIFFSMYLPAFWHLGFKIPGRTENVILFYSQIVILFFTIFLTSKYNLKDLHLIKSPYFKVISIIIITVILNNRTNFKNVVNEINTGDARQYYEQNINRLVQIQENKMDTIKVKALTIKPKTLYFDDFAVEVDNWLNISIAKVMKSKPILMEE